MNGEWIVGAAKVDITPPQPIPLAGFAHRSEVYEGVAQRLYARIWIFAEPSVQGIAEAKAILIQADLIWWGSDQIRPLLDKIVSRWGIKEEAVIFHASHTHGGPQTSSRFVPMLGLADSAYLAWLEGQVLSGIGEAHASMEPVMVEMGKGSCPLGIHRRKRMDGRMNMAPNPEGAADPEVTVIRMTATDGRIKGIWFHYTCHPTTTGDNWVTSEYPGAAMERLERQLGGQVIATFLQGYCGDIRPALIKDGQFFRGNDEDVKRLGRQLADEVIRVLDAPMQQLESASIQASAEQVELAFVNYLSSEQLAKDRTADGAAAQRSELFQSDPSRNEQPAKLQLNYLQLAKELVLVGANAEMVVEYGLYLKQEINPHILPLGYTNGMIGYVPTAEQIAEGGYEGGESAVYFGLPGAFTPAIEGQIKTAFKSLNRLPAAAQD
ncbi:neutral/alkaline non-lysosomal ceramidase N-terminal domain-containing protein [Paenibacillus senegalensis]|uniref:neutral/alkaline non-lysosomal ceramidase N-terminal domain-containing protein n=1 Tax=Paenibacillus senegalensis TaxID=1465766 RepID=UPI00028A3CB5|nr:neutral/alkaline non-lysosomal ceramidase N-terminal domain-containing protein [Paenibacillus senegalensis]